MGWGEIGFKDYLYCYQASRGKFNFLYCLDGAIHLSLLIKIIFFIFLTITTDYLNFSCA